MSVLSSQTHILHVNHFQHSLAQTSRLPFSFKKASIHGEFVPFLVKTMLKLWSSVVLEMPQELQFKMKILNEL